MSSRKKRVGREVRSRKPSDRAGPSTGEGMSTFRVCDQLRFKKGHQSLGTLTLRGVQHPEEADPSPRKAMKVMCSIPERNRASFIVFIVGSAI